MVRVSLIVGLVGISLAGSLNFYEVATGHENTPVTIVLLLGEALTVVFWLVIPGFLAARGFWRWLRSRGNR